MKIKSNGDKIYGPYPDKKKDGRLLAVVRHPDGSTTSTEWARYKYESKHGDLPRGTDVDHKDNNKDNNSMRNLQPMQHSKNIAKGNKADPR